MKFLAVILLSIISSFAYGQNYSCPVGYYHGTSIPEEDLTTIAITDSMVEIKVARTSKTYSYNLVKKANDMIYFTDGVMTHYFQITERKDKLKGHEFTHEITFKLDARQDDVKNILYCTLK